MKYIIYNNNVLEINNLSTSKNGRFFFEVEGRNILVSEKNIFLTRESAEQSLEGRIAIKKNHWTRRPLTASEERRCDNINNLAESLKRKMRGEDDE